MSMMPSPKSDRLPWLWAPRPSTARRPLLTSEKRMRAPSRTTQLLPWPRSTGTTVGRSMLPWESRAANDWRGVRR